MRKPRCSPRSVQSASDDDFRGLDRDSPQYAPSAFSPNGPKGRLPSSGRSVEFFNLSNPNLFACALVVFRTVGCGVSDILPEHTCIIRPVARFRRTPCFDWRPFGTAGTTAVGQQQVVTSYCCAVDKKKVSPHNQVNRFIIIAARTRGGGWRGKATHVDYGYPLLFLSTMAAKRFFHFSLSLARPRAQYTMTENTFFMA